MNNTGSNGWYSNCYYYYYGALHESEYLSFLLLLYSAPWWCGSVPNQEGRVIIPCIGLRHMFCFHGKQPCSWHLHVMADSKGVEEKRIGAWPVCRYRGGISMSLRDIDQESINVIVWSVVCLRNIYPRLSSLGHIPHTKETTPWQWSESMQLF